MLYTGCFSYTSRLKWCLQELHPQTSAQYAIYRMFLLHIRAKMLPMANISHKTMPRILWGVSLTHPGSYGALCGMSSLPIQAEIMPTWSSSHKRMPSMSSAGCFSYTSRLKWCLQDLHPQTSAQYAIYRMFLLHIQAETVPMTSISHKTMPRTLWDVCLTHPG